ncbi:MAG: glycosyltransferase [Candidatus Aenigmatarchaeota archaeon]
MRIGIFTDTYFPQINGVTYTIDLWKKKLEERGHEVLLFYPSSDYIPKKNEFPMRSFNFRFYEGYRVALPSWVIRNAKDLDMVHIHGMFSPAVAGVYVARRLKIPRMQTFHTPGDEYVGYVTKRRMIKKSLTKIYNFWEKKLLNSFEIVTCPSDVIKKRLTEKGIKNITVLANGIDTDFFSPVDREEFRKKYCVESEKLIGFCGRICYEKRLEDLIGIADRFDGQIIIIGNGPAEKHYRRLARRKKNVQFLGFLSKSDQRAFYSALDIFVFPSVAETQGLVALEAMACGTPVVGANEMALKETIKDGNTGYLYDSANLDDLERKIFLAYKNRKRLSKKCISYARSHSVDRTVDKLLSLYSRQISEFNKKEKKKSSLLLAGQKLQHLFRERKDNR